MDVNTCSHKALGKLVGIRYSARKLLCNTVADGIWTQSGHSGTESKLIGNLRSRQSRVHAHTGNDILDLIYVPDHDTAQNGLQRCKPRSKFNNFIISY